MFYIYEGKVYSAMLDEESGVYPQVKIAKHESGYSTERAGMGLKERPKGAARYTLEEVLARYTPTEDGEEEE